MVAPLVAPLVTPEPILIPHEPLATLTNGTSKSLNLCSPTSNVIHECLSTYVRTQH